MMELWPFTNFHDLNLDWLISKWKKLEDNLDDIHASMDAAEGYAEDAKGYMQDAKSAKTQAAIFATQAGGKADEAAASAASIQGVATQVQTNTNRIDNIVATAGDGTIPSELSDIRVGWDSELYTTAGTAVRSQISALHKDQYPVYARFERGGLNIGTTGWVRDLSNQNRVHVNPDDPLELYAGDKIYLTDYSNTRMYLGFRDPVTQTYTYQSWITSGYYKLASDMEVVILLAKNPEGTITDVDELLRYLRIETSSTEVVLDNSNIMNTASDAFEKVDFPYWNIGANVKGINHRGYYTGPENTLPAYKLSKQNGFTYVECDISWTLDRVPVLLHDATINRTARTGNGDPIGNPVDITSITYQQALAYDFGIYKGEQFAGTKIPEFGQFISLCRKIGLRPYIELKAYGSPTTAEIQMLVNTTRDYAMKDKVTWISFDLPLLEIVKNYDPDARLGLVTMQATLQDVANALSLRTGTNEVFIDSSDIPDAVRNECIDNDLPAEIWTIDSDVTMLSLHPYISGVTSDNYVYNKVLYENNI